jgi:glycosyltransferase involved in cell wall biosynthesis
LRLALVTLNDSTDVHEWSGLNYHIARSLERAGATLHRIGPLESRWSPLMRLRQRWYDATSRSYHASADPGALAAMGANARAQIPAGVDAVLAVTSLVAAALGPLSVPLVSWDDATAAALMGYYPDFQHVAPVSRRQTDALGRRAASSVALAIYASDWAAASARRAYGLTAERVAVVPFGANLEQLPPREQVHAAIESRESNVCRLLWVGVDWERKGGQLAVSIAQALRDARVKVELTVVGCEPPQRAALPPWVRVEGFISKRTHIGEARLAALFARSHFFVMPSKAEAYGLVYAEAAAFGVPAVAIRTGGVPTIVVDNGTGLLERPEAGAEKYAERMLSLFRDRDAYQRMAHAARQRAEDRLNWNVAGADVVARLERLVATNGVR